MIKIREAFTVQAYNTNIKIKCPACGFESEPGETCYQVNDGDKPYTHPVSWGYCCEKHAREKYVESAKLKEDAGDTIHQQITATDRNALMAWGAYNKAKQGPNNGIVGYMKKNDGYFMFACKCPKFSGKVIILLMLDDTYSIVFGKVDKDSTGFMDWRISKIVEDVYVEDLVRVIDDFVG